MKRPTSNQKGYSRRRIFILSGQGLLGSTLMFNKAVAQSKKETGKKHDWRYCGKCHGIFYAGYPDNGRCAAGGGHNAIGYNLVLPHPGE